MADTGELILQRSCGSDTSLSDAVDVVAGLDLWSGAFDFGFWFGFLVSILGLECWCRFLCARDAFSCHQEFKVKGVGQEPALSGVKGGSFPHNHSVPAPSRLVGAGGLTQRRR